MAGATWNCCHLGAFCVHRTTMHHVTSCKSKYVRCMRVLAVTCHLHFRQNDRDLLRDTAVTRGWNGYRNQSQHKKLTLEKKILPPLLQGFEPATFQSRVRRSNHWAIPLGVARRRTTGYLGVAKIFTAGYLHGDSKETLLHWNFGRQRDLTTGCLGLTWRLDCTEWNWWQQKNTADQLGGWLQQGNCTCRSPIGVRVEGIVSFPQVCRKDVTTARNH